MGLPTRGMRVILAGVGQATCTLLVLLTRRLPRELVHLITFVKISDACCNRGACLGMLHVVPHEARDEFSFAPLEGRDGLISP